MREKEREMMLGKAAVSKGHRSSLPRGRRPPRPDLASSPRPTPPDPGRSLRPRRARPFVADDFLSSSSGEEDEDGERRKLKLVLKLPHSPDSPAISRLRILDAARVLPSVSSSSSDSASSTSFSSYADEDAVMPLKKRRINGRDDGVDGSGHLLERKKNVARRSKGPVLGTSPNTQKGTRLPDRKTLEEILDKLQKKDTYKVYAEPVDPEELPDYNEVIEHPMDFGTIRKKLAKSAYRTFEQFEDDVFLICSNAMQYNAPHTIYFRQARAIEEMARKNFQILRDEAKSIESERKTEEKTRFSSTEKKLLKKPVYRAEKEPLGSDISSSATLASAGDTCTRLSTGHANGLKLKRANTCEHPAISNGSSTTRVNAVEKAATCRGLNTVPVNGVSRTQVNTVQKQTTPNGLSAERSRTVVKPSTANVLTMEQANAVDQPGTANGLSMTQADAVEKSGNANGLSMTPANATEKPEASNRSSTIEAIADEKPVTSNGSDSAQANAVEKLTTANGSAECSSSPDESKEERVDEISAKCSPSKLGRKPLLVDENRRTTYNLSEQQLVVESDSVFHVFDSETKQLVDVGPLSEYSYARSLARFAAFLGPTGWEIASKQIEKVLPAGLKFGPGWVGEYEPLPTPVLSLENHTQKKIEKSIRKPKLHSEEHKQGLFGHSADIQPRASSATLQQQNDPKAVDFTEACSDAPEQVSVSNSSSVTSIPVETTFRRPEYPSQAQKQGVFGLSASTQQRIPSAVFRKDTRAQNLSPVSSISSRTMNSLSGKNTLGLSVGGLSSPKDAGMSDNNKAFTSLEFASNRQSGVAGGNRERAIDFRLMDLSGKISNQASYLNSSVYSAKQVASPIPPPTRDDSSAASRAWMSFNGTDIAHTQTGSVSSHGSVWRTPASAARVHGNSMVRPWVLPQPIPLVSEESQVRNRGLVFFPQLAPTDLSRFHGPSPWQGLSPLAQPRQMDMRPPDLNIGFQHPTSPVRPSSGILVDSQQPDLALQL